MRKIVAAVAATLTLLVAAAAIGATGNSGTTVQQYDQTYSSKARKKSTGTRLSTFATDETNTAQNRQPKRITNFDVTFPAGSKIDSRAAPQCKATNNDFAGEQNPDDACPRGSKIGSGSAAIRADVNGFADVVGVVRVYNANKGLLLHMRFTSAALGSVDVVMRPKFRGLKLLTPVPQICIPPGSPANNCRDSFGNERDLVLTRLQLRTSPVRNARRTRVLFRTPRTCPQGGWGFTANVKYSDGSSLRIPETSPCRG